MKTRLSTLFLLFIFLSSTMAFGAKEGASVKNDATDKRLNEVVVYAYDSFTADWGAAPEIIRLFEEKTGYKCTMISVGDAAQVLSRAVLEKSNPQADVLIGIDSQLFDKAKAQNVLTPYKPKDADTLIDASLKFDDEWTLTPYDWSHFAMIYDSTSNVSAPTSIEDLANPEYAKKIILMDPRTSTPGLGFVAWTLAIFGDGSSNSQSAKYANYTDYWKALKPNILTMAPSWDTGYGLFTAGEAPLVISYTTSAAYHVECDNIDRFKCLVFAEGHPMQVEGAGIIQNAPNTEGAKSFMDFLITLEAQNVLPTTQWMYPSNSSVILPESYEASPKAPKTLTVDNKVLNRAAENVINILAE